MFKKGEVVKIGKSVFLVENVWKGDVNVIYRLRARNVNGAFLSKKRLILSGQTRI